jgi:hypothetical protein
VLDVDGVVKLQHGFTGSEVLPVIFQDQRLSQIRTAPADACQHVDIVRLAEATRQNQQAHA